MKSHRTYISLLLIAAVFAGLTGCAAPLDSVGALKAVDLTGHISAGSVVVGKPADDVFIASMADFSVELFKKSITAGQNSLISPLSVMLALSMIANGADGETLTQMETLLGSGIPLTKLNEYLFSYAQSLSSGEKSKLRIANSLWFRDDGDSLQVRADFLQKNADYYRAAAYSSSFDNQTVNDINNWVKSNTDGMIDQILDEIQGLDMLYLINAVVFDAEWQNVYTTESVRKGDFTETGGMIRNVDFMHGAEYGYLDDGFATGFVKPYANGGYSFAALLPYEGVSLEAYIESLSGAGLLDILADKQEDTLVFTSMPRFSYTYSIKMIDALRSLGIRDAFDAQTADFGRMATTTAGNGNLYLSEVLHKTFIAVDELGTKAGAVTMGAMSSGGTPLDPKVVNLDRPFVYAIIDNATNLPIFIGTLLTVR